MADAQVWTVIALLAAIFAIVIEMRRMNDRITDGFASLTQDINDLRLESQGEHAQLRTEIVELRHDLRWHTEHDHRPSA